MRDRKLANKKYYDSHKKQESERHKKIYQLDREYILTRNNKWVDNNRQHLRKYQQAWGQKIKCEVLSYYSVDNIPICEKCLEKGIRVTDLNLLSIDHIYGGGSKHRKSLNMRGRNFYSWLKRNNYPDGYRVLCLSCNSKLKDRHIV